MLQLEIAKQIKSIIICTFIAIIFGVGVGGVRGVVVGSIVGVILSVLIVNFLPSPTEEEIEDYRQRQQSGPKSKYIPNIKCPTCQSLTVEKISTSTKVGYVLLTGILAPAFKKVRSQFECKTCGYKW